MDADEMREIANLTFIVNIFTALLQRKDMAVEECVPRAFDLAIALKKEMVRRNEAADAKDCPKDCTHSNTIVQDGLQVCLACGKFVDVETLKLMDGQ